VGRRVLGSAVRLDLVDAGPAQAAGVVADEFGPKEPAGGGQDIAAQVVAGQEAGPGRVRARPLDQLPVG
jgi:hypothetical protein